MDFCDDSYLNLVSASNAINSLISCKNKKKMHAFESSVKQCFFARSYQNARESIKSEAMGGFMGFHYNSRAFLKSYNRVSFVFYRILSDRYVIMKPHETPHGF
jgi:hypothetical protein